MEKRQNQTRERIYPGRTDLILNKVIQKLSNTKVL